MKKILTIMLLCITIFLCFGACSSKNAFENQQSESEETVISIYDVVCELDAHDIFDDCQDEYAVGNINVEYSNFLKKMDIIDELNQKWGFTGGLVNRMKQTRGIDGVQEEENEDFKVTWSYTKPRLSITYERK